MLSIIFVDRIQDCLRDISSVVDAQQRRDIDFPRKVLDWLTRAEGVLHDARQASLSQISTLRSNLLATYHGARKTAGQSRRGQLESVASEVLAKGQAVLGAVIEPRLGQIAEAELLASRVLAVAAVKGLLHALPNGESHEDKLRHVLGALKQDADTAGATVHFVGILGPVDSLVVLDRVLGNQLLT